jgi:hypothetical protein
MTGELHGVRIITPCVNFYSHVWAISRSRAPTYSIANSYMKGNEKEIKETNSFYNG